jgi:hypothetical protein
VLAYARARAGVVDAATAAALRAAAWWLVVAGPLGAVVHLLWERDLAVCRAAALDPDAKLKKSK